MASIGFTHPVIDNGVIENGLRARRFEVEFLEWGEGELSDRQLGEGCEAGGEGDSADQC